MSIIKNPIILAIIASAIVMVVMCYLKNKKSENNDDNENNKNKKKKKKKRRNKYTDDEPDDESNDDNEKNSYETQIIVALIAGIITWWGASAYFKNSEDVKVEMDNTLVPENIVSVSQNVKTSQNSQVGGVNINSVMNKHDVSHISSDDQTRSYNLIGSGINIPRSELNIPNVLIDYN